MIIAQPPEVICHIWLLIDIFLTLKVDSQI